MREFDDFNEFADNYREIHNRSVAGTGADSNYYSEYKIVIVHELEKAKSIDQILDFGCGDGNSSISLRKYFPNSKIYGIDPSEDSIEKARSLGLENTEFNVYNGKDIPYSCRFDLIFCSMVFHHIEFNKHSNILDQLRLSLVPGGRLYIFEHNPLNPITRKIVKDCPFDKDAKLLSHSYCKRIIEDSELSVARLRFTLFFPRHKIFTPFHKLEKHLSGIPLGAQYYISSIRNE